MKSAYAKAEFPRSWCHASDRIALTLAAAAFFVVATPLGLATAIAFDAQLTVAECEVDNSVIVGRVVNGVTFKSPTIDARCHSDELIRAYSRDSGNVVISLYGDDQHMLEIADTASEALRAKKYPVFIALKDQYEEGGNSLLIIIRGQNDTSTPYTIDQRDIRIIDAQFIVDRVVDAVNRYAARQ